MKASLAILLLLLGSLAPAAALEAWDPAHRFVVAQSLVLEGAYQEALEIFTELVELEPDDPFVRLEYAKLLFRLGRLEAAAAQAAEARRLAPSNADALRLYGQIHLRWADRNPQALELAQGAFELLREIDPSEVEPLVTLGQIYLSRGRFDAARDLFASLLDWRPRDRMLVAFMIDAIERVGPDAASEKALRAFVEADPSFLRAVLTLAEIEGRRGEHEAAAEVLEKALEMGAGESEVARRLAYELYRAGRGDDALAAVDRAIEALPGDTGSRYLRALILLALERVDDSVAELEALLAENPDHLEVADLLARLLEGRGEEAEAATVLQGVAARLIVSDRPAEARAARLALAELEARREAWPAVLELTAPMVSEASPVDRRAVSLRAEALAETGHAEEALELLATAGEIEEADAEFEPELTLRRAEILLGLERLEEAEGVLAPFTASEEVEDLLLAIEVYQRSERYAEAVPLLERALSREPDSLQLLFRLGASYERTDRHDDAVVRFERLLELDPEFAPALNYLGYMWAERGENLEEAVELVERAVSLDPDNGAYVDSLGWAYFQLGRFDEARAQLERAAELEPDDPVIYEHLGDLYRAVGERDRAVEIYHRSLGLDGDNRDQVEQKLLELDESR